VLVVPYDFDVSGLVNARYAFPDRRLRIKKVTQRVYRGLCTDRDVLRAAIEKVTAHKAGILRTVQEIPGLSEENADVSTRFLNAFFEKADDTEELIENFEKRCIGD